MATYPGLSLRGEVRESVSLDEDDLSDVEDEVFIRDGKSGYKFEDMSVKKPLMAPRRKITKSEAKVRFKARRPCTKAACKPCCYAFISLAALIGLMAIVVVLVSIFPLPLDTFKRWVVSDEAQRKAIPRLVPCSELKVTEMWTASFPHLTSEAEVRVLDANQDGIEDVLLGFGTDNPKLPPEVFCQMYFGTPPPCQGGVIAINGRDGEILWKRHLPHTVFSLHCSADVNNDNVTDCLVTGKAGIFTVINTRDGSAIWSFVDSSAEESLIMDVYFGNFIPDQNEDGVSDILAAHTSQKGNSRVGHLLLVSGKTGEELRKVSLPNGTETFYTPQIFSPNNNGSYTVLFGTGGPTTPGNLSVVDLSDLLLHAENMTITTLYEGRYKGVMSPSVLTDITGDGSVDIVTSAINSTIVAVDGRTLKQIWNYTVDNSESFGTPTPAYFNYDNLTDFLVRFQVGPGFPTYYYSQTVIIDGRTGKPIYSEPMVSSMGSQAEALTLGMERYGFDHYLFSNLDCRGYEHSKDKFGFIPGEDVRQYSRADLCKLRFNTTTEVTMHALSQFNQPPGIVVYNSDKHAALEYNNAGELKKKLAAYLKAHPETFQRSDLKEVQSNAQDYKPNADTFKTTRYKDGSNFRHKDNGNVLLQQFDRKSEKHPDGMDQIGQKFAPDYYQNMDNWQSELSPFESEDGFEGDYSGYLENPEANPGPYDPSKPLWRNPADNHRNPRSKIRASTAAPPQGSTTQTPMDYDIYDYQNVQKSRSKLMQDLNSSPTEILKQTYFKNLERQLRKSRFQQRDIESEADKVKENEQIQAAIEEKKKELANTSESLWDLETEKEEEDRKNGYWRGKREVNTNSSAAVYGIPRVTSTGAVIQSINSTRDTIDIILVTYWSTPKSSAKILLEEDIECIIGKLNSTKNIGDRMEETYMNECLGARGIFSTKGATSKKSEAFGNPQQPSDFSLGQMTVYRLQLECVCHGATNEGERCARFLKSNQRH